MPVPVETGIVGVFLNHIRINPNAVDNDGETLLHLAVFLSIFCHPTPPFLLFLFFSFSGESTR
uniref:Uncharacterized protein n=1 Tax=Octopus bimaculoides TaxID=37653 RepID=A0A0L8G7P5_OCTBM